MESSVSRRKRIPVAVLAGLLGSLVALLLAPVSHAEPEPEGRPAGTTPAVPMPSDPGDLQGWLAYKTAHGLPALPHRARVLYRHGVEAQARGDMETAVRVWRGAEELDPAFLAPRVALAGHFLGRDPSQGLIEVARIVGLARTHFRLQHFLVSYGLFFLFTALYLASLGVALLLCWRHRTRLQHVYRELLSRRLPGRRAAVWAWVLVALPFAFGLGVAVPAVFTLALLWSYLRRTERVALALLVAGLVGAPFAVRLFDELAQPARESQPPFYSTLNVDQEPYRLERLAELSALAAADPENPFLAYAVGWMAQRGRQYDQAVAAYERAQMLWPREARIPNNLGNIELMRGNAEAAERHYQRATTLAPRWAGPHYNLGQLYTARFRYAEASEEIAQATALDFDLVRTLQARSSAQATPALAEDWLEPPVQWQALFATPREAGAPASVPPPWRPWFESRGFGSAVLALVMALAGLALGLVLHHHLPARMCGNCDGAVCRRCAARRRDQILCPECAGLLQNATTPEFGRLLLFKRRREMLKRQGRIRTVFAALVPGYGAVAYDRVLAGWLLALGAALCALFLFAGAAPFPYDPRVLADAPRPLAGLAFAGFVICHLVSLATFLSLHGRAREDETERNAAASRPAPRVQRAAA